MYIRNGYLISLNLLLAAKSNQHELIQIGGNWRSSAAARRDFDNGATAAVEGDGEDDNADTNKDDAAHWHGAAPPQRRDTTQ